MTLVERVKARQDPINMARFGSLVRQVSEMSSVRQFVP